MKLRLARKARLVRRVPTGTRLVVYPERALELNASAAEIVELCDGTRSPAELVEALALRHPDVPASELESAVLGLLRELGRRALIEPA
jgi:pyrroloquinoline quinone biosynthesis protein D